MRSLNLSQLNLGRASLVAAAALAAACSSGATSGQCTVNNALTLYFTPMYSAYDGTHQFQIPAVVNGVDQSRITWSASDPSVASVAADPLTGGAMITVLKAGTVSITAMLGDVCGTSELTIDSATADMWTAGNARYHNGQPALLADAGPHSIAFNPQAACVNCHNENATPTPGDPFTAVSHTPEQAGGFSDTDLQGIFLHGQVPDGGYFDSTIIPENRWSQFHQWSMTDAEAAGIIVYLRSLTPAPQMGSANFGGHGYDGGHGGHGSDAGLADGG